MKNKRINSSMDYKQQEEQLANRSRAFIGMLTERGILEDKDINDEQVRKAVQDKRRNMYHNTQLMLQHYRDIVWTLECFPGDLAMELDTPLNDLDALLSHIDAEIGLDNLKLENRLRSLQKSRLLLDRINEALTVLRQKPRNGELMYNILYYTYITPDKLTHAEIIYRLDICSRHYYRLRSEAVRIMSIRLWATPAAEIDAWLELLTLFETL